MTQELLGEELCDLYCMMKDSSLFHITPSIQSISFEIDNMGNLHVLVNVLKSIKSEEMAHIKCFKDNLIKNYKNKGEVNFSLAKMVEGEILEVKELAMMFFLTYLDDDYYFNK